MPRLSRADALRAKKAAYERARRAKKRAEAAQGTAAPVPHTGPLTGAALYHALQDQVTTEVAPTPWNVIQQGYQLMQGELARTQQQLTATQDELTRVLNIGLSGETLRTLVHDVEEMLHTLRRLVGVRG